MPNVADFSSEQEWMGACVPKMMDEGKPNEQAVAACMSMWKEKKSIGGMSIDDAVKHFLAHEAEKGWVTINGAHVLIGEDEGGGGGSGNRGAIGWKSPRDEFRFVQRRLAAGGLKRGEKRMLERRSERLAKQVLGVKP